jgi:hypothetical protein
VTVLYVQIGLWAFEVKVRGTRSWTKLILDRARSSRCRTGIEPRSDMTLARRGAVGVGKQRHCEVGIWKDRFGPSVVMLIRLKVSSDACSVPVSTIERGSVQDAEQTTCDAAPPHRVRLSISPSFPHEPSPNHLHISIYQSSFIITPPPISPILNHAPRNGRPKPRSLQSPPSFPLSNYVLPPTNAP